MTLNPLTALAIPVVGIAAVKVAHRVADNRPFANFLESLRERGQADKLDADTAVAESGNSESAQLLEKFAARVQQTLAEAGIRTSIRFELAADASGRLHVVGEHPKKQEIERALAGNSELADIFTQLAASQQLEEVNQRQDEFAEQYVRGPTPLGAASPAAAPPHFSVLINGDEVSIAQQR